MALNLLLPLITRSRQTTYWQQAHSALRMKDEVFYSLLRAEPHYNVDSQHASSILFGRPDAPVRITIYSNPYCNPCAQMHKRLHHLDHTNCCIQYIFTAFSEAYEPINKYLIAAYQTYGPDKAMLLFDAWYGKEDKQDETFFTQMQLDIQAPAVLQEFKRHTVWRTESQLHATPTILVNGYLLPKGYNVEDLQFFIEKQQSIHTDTE